MFKLGDKVRFTMDGFIEYISLDDEYPILISFENGTKYTFTKKGKLYSTDKKPCLKLIPKKKKKQVNHVQSR